MGLWYGVHQRRERHWLRFYDADGRWIATPLEQQEQRTERLAAKLRALGIEPDE
jgi:hypothetical protein